MRVLTLQKHGFKLGTDSNSGGKKRPRGDRSMIGGWSPGACRRNIDFLRSVDETRLDGVAMALTLTVRDCPPSSDEWHRLRNLFIANLRNWGLLRLHWVIEWQRRGVPHLHCAAYFDNPDPLLIDDIKTMWCRIAGHWGAARQSQYILPIYDDVGWYQYVSKHAARGVNHYQRSPENIPALWQRKTGRMWGKCGDWPTLQPGQVHMTDAMFYQFRRLVKRWRIADSRAEGSIRRLIAARRYLQVPERLSRVMGASEWLPEENVHQVLYFLLSQGYDLA